MNDHDLTNHMVDRQAEKDKWAKVQGKEPDTAGSFPPIKFPEPKHCGKIKQPCATPYQCSPACRLVQSQGGHQVDHGMPIQMLDAPRWYHRPPSLYFFAVVGALIGFAAAVYQTF